VTLENTSGTTYPQAGLRLIAGDVRRVRDPWARRSPEDVFRAPAAARPLRLGEVLIAGDQIKVFAEQSLFEYHLYALNTPCTVGDHQIKQLNLLKKKGAKATRRYIFDPREEQCNLAVELLVKNEETNELGMPLPKGAYTLQQRGQDGELAVVGQGEIDHTAVKEELKLRYGHAFDVVGEHRDVLVEKIDKGSRITFETRIRNHKATPIAVRSFADLLDGELQQASMPHVVENSRLIYFDFTLPANAEQVMRYTVVYRSGK
jgi:hypothetical protein